MEEKGKPNFRNNHIKVFDTTQIESTPRSKVNQNTDPSDPAIKKI